MSATTLHQSNVARIRKMKKERGANQAVKDIAEMSGVSESMVRKILTGERPNPSVKTVDSISNALDVLEGE